MPADQQELTIKLHPDLLDALHDRAAAQGIAVDDLTAAAVVRLLNQPTQARPHVLSTYDHSHHQFADLYTKLAE